MMSNVWDSVQGGKGQGNKSNVPIQREFFWDTAVVYVAFSIFVLVALDFVIEFIRGNEVVCSPPYANISTDEVNYINQVCTTNLPFGVHVSIFMLVHGILVAFPHYVWSYHFSASINYFFQLVGTLQRVKEDTGQYSTNNVIIVKQLEETFSANKHAVIFYLYIIKIGFQLAFVISGLVFVIAFFHGKFEPLFICTNTFNGATDFWPIDADVTCVFHPLNLLEGLWIADILLLVLAGCALVRALIWCVSIHPKELGSSDIANFVYHYGLPSKYFVSKAPLFHLHYFGSMFQLGPFMRRISCSGPRIRTHLDFLIMKLYCTDGFLGDVFKEIQIRNLSKQLCDGDRRRLHIHARKHRNFLTEDNNDEQQSHKVWDNLVQAEELRWTFRKSYQRVGIYSDFQTLPSDRPIILPGTIRGTVLGFSARAPSNDSAIEVSFGIPSFATALARVFKSVTAVNFSSDYKSTKRAFTARYDYANTLSLTCSEDILSCESPAKNEFLDGLKMIWNHPGSDSFLHTGFVVLGPIPQEKSFHMATMDLLLDNIAGCLCKDAVLLVVRPLQISNKDVSNLFSSYKPPKPSFLPLEQTYDVIHKVQEWIARKSSLQSIITSSRVLQSPGRDQSLFRFNIVSGDIPSIMEFTTYHYTDNPHYSIPDIYNPDPPSTKSRETCTTQNVPTNSSSLQHFEREPSAYHSSRETNL